LNSEARTFIDPRLSPDGRRVAIQVGADLWTFDSARGTHTRLTFEPGENETPEWAPDGAWIAYAASEAGKPTVVRRRADGAGPPEHVWSAPDPQMHIHVHDWTADGRMLVISHPGPQGSGERQISVLELDGDRASKPLLHSHFNIQGGRVSPDGRWIAYVSNESGRTEVYVQPFPSLNGKWQISTGGGTQPVWSRTGDELFYRGEGAVLAVRVSTGGSFSAEPPQKLFEDRFYFGGSDRTGYDVSPDGQRFLMLKQSMSDQQTAALAQSIVVVMNWQEELKRLVPVN
jgi:Tol biopolymer transport system component